MVAGCSGVRAIVLVVAADDGIMPQTREHLLIAERLGIDARHRGDHQGGSGRRRLARPGHRQMSPLSCARSPIAFTGPLPVSAVRGDGVAGLRAAIAAIAAAAGAPSGRRPVPAPGRQDLPSGRHRHHRHRHRVVGAGPRRGSGAPPSHRPGRPRAEHRSAWRGRHRSDCRTTRGGGACRRGARRNRARRDSGASRTADGSVPTPPMR